MDEYDLFLGVWGCDVTVTFRLLYRRCGPLRVASTARFMAFSLKHLESFWEAMLDLRSTIRRRLYLNAIDPTRHHKSMELQADYGDHLRERPRQALV